MVLLRTYYLRKFARGNFGVSLCISNKLLYLICSRSRGLKWVGYNELSLIIIGMNLFLLIAVYFLCSILDSITAVRSSVELYRVGGIGYFIAIKFVYVYD